jgi:hypothetical protein
MSEFWYNNLLILTDDLYEFYPKKNFNKIHKINAIARLAIYYGIIIIIFKFDNKYLSLSLFLLLVSYFLGITNNDKFENTKCINPTKNNPFMNFTLGDHILDPNRPPACSMNKDIRNKQIKNFRYNIFPDVSDMYGKIVTDRNFYTMPCTTAVNDQEGFLKFLYSDMGKCKSEGKDCLKHRDNQFSRGRYYYQY